MNAVNFFDLSGWSSSPAGLAGRCASGGFGSLLADARSRARTDVTNAVHLLDLSGRTSGPVGLAGRAAPGGFGSLLARARSRAQTDVITLRLPGENCIYSGGRMGNRINQTIYVEYTEDSTAEDPIVRIEGKADSGSFDFICHINDIDPENATYAEMTALFGHLVHTGVYQGSGGQVTPYGFEYHGSVDLMKRQNFIRGIADVSVSGHVDFRGREDAKYLLGLYQEYVK